MEINTKYKILMVIGQFYPFLGGTEVQCLKLSKELIRQGHRVKVLTSWQFRDLPRLEEIEGVPIERVWYPILRIKGRRLLGFGFLCRLTMAYRVYSELKKYDIVHVHQALWPAFSALIAARLRRKPIVCKIGNSGNIFDLLIIKNDFLIGAFASWLLKRKVDRFIWTSQAIYKDLRLIKIPDKKLAYIPNGIELNGVISRQTLNKQTMHFVCVGSLTPKKNIVTIIDAIKNLNPHYRDRLVFEIFGDGPEKERLISLVKKYSLDSIVKFKGTVSNIKEHLLKSDIFVLPSLTEGLSNACLEAMSCGLALILSYSGGNTDLIELDDYSASIYENSSVSIGRNGIFFNPWRVDSLTAALKYFIDNPSKINPMGKYSRSIIERRYSLPDIVEQWLSIYKECIRH